MFGLLLGPRSFDGLEIPLLHKQASFPRKATFGIIKFIPITTIAPVAYLKDGPLVASIIVVKFIIDQCPFLFEALI
jgi:hypothetical protein